MLFHAVHDRCAVDFDEWRLPLSPAQIVERLNKLGFSFLEVDVVDIAKNLVDRADFKFRAKMADAPTQFDCSSLIKWLYGQKGIWLPRRSIQQSEVGTTISRLDDVLPGDLIFTSGYDDDRDYFFDDPAKSIGHVSLMTERQQIICATNSELGRGVIKMPIQRLLATRRLQKNSAHRIKKNLHRRDSSNA